MNNAMVFLQLPEVRFTARVKSNRSHPICPSACDSAQLSTSWVTGHWQRVKRIIWAEAFGGQCITAVEKTKSQPQNEMTQTLTLK